MDPFLPGEIPVMVLRYLAANKCETASLSLINELPLLKSYVPSKPAKVSNSDYLRHLARCSVNPGLKEVLADYGNSKLWVEEILEDSEDMLPMLPSDSLLNKLKALRNLMSTTQPSNSSAAKTLVDAEVDAPPAIVQTDKSINTNDYECPKCLRGRLETKTFIDSSCQTEEFTAVQFGLKEEIPLIFYNALLSDDGLQQKIAQTINEHLQDPPGERNEDFVQKISSKAETEIDKFLVDLLQDMPSDESSNNIFQIGGGTLSTVNQLGCPPSFADLNLSSMFPDTGLFENTGGNEAGLESEKQVITPTEKQSKADDGKSTECTTPPSDNAPVKPKNNRRSSSASTKSHSKLIIPTQNRGAAVKRITPTRLSGANSNPVFNSSVVIERQNLESTKSNPKVSVVTVNCEQSGWEKLNRKSIVPKIPGLVSPKITSNVTVTVNDRSRADSPKRLLEVGNGSETTSCVEHQSSNTVETKGRDPKSSQKRKATPVKLTPEKANNREYNFMHVYHEPNKPPTNSTKGVCLSNVKKTPLPPSSLLNSSVPGKDSVGGQLVSSVENFQSDVTPMQPPPVSDALTGSEIKTISPNALQRLIASANKLGPTMPNLHFNKKKSYSTPRKRKHVRNLTFTTPPTLKAGTAGSASVDGGQQKRKATEELLEFKSKKRLNWSENKKSGDNAVPAVPNQGSPEKSSLRRILPKHTGDVQHSSGGPQVAPGVNILGASSQSMPTILEESSGGQASNLGTPISSVKNSEKTSSNGALGTPKLTFITIPATLNDGSIHYQYYQLGEDMQLYPVQFITSSGGAEPNASPLQQPLVGAGGDGMPLLVDLPPAAPLPQDPTHSTSVFIPPPPPQVQHTPITRADNERLGSKSAERLDSSTSSKSLEFASVVSSSQVLASPRRPPVPPVLHQDISPVPPLPKDPYPNVKITPPPPLPPEPHPLDITPPLAPRSISELSDSSTLVTVVPLRTSHTPDHSSACERPANSTFLDTSNVGRVPHPKRRSYNDTSKTCSNELNTKSLSTEHNEHSKKSQRTRKSTRLSLSQKQQDSNAAQQSFVGQEPQGGTKSLVSPIPPMQNYMTKDQGDKAETSPKKPRLTLNITDLFGESPTKARNLRSSKKDPKRPIDVIAAQTVADEAIPLGTPRRSPRKHPVKTPQSVKLHTQQPHPAVDIFGIDSRANLVPATNLHQPLPQPEHIAFSIEPAPLGFPEPTPIKNFVETGFLNITSEIGMRSPLITPLKTSNLGPPGLNETHFTLPPTPRIIDDLDSNSNSTHSLKLMYDGGMYPSNLLTSTPFKAGLPRTPGKGNGSSNSHSPTVPEKIPTGAVEQQQQQPLPAPSLELSSTVNSTAAWKRLSSSRKSEKSDGEISSSEDDNSQCLNIVSQYHSVPNKDLQKQLPTEKGETSKASSRSGNIERAVRQPPPPLLRPHNMASSAGPMPQLSVVPSPQISVSLNSNIKQTHGINFQVGGRGKKLTMSEQETLYSLIHLGTEKVQGRQEENVNITETRVLQKQTVEPPARNIAHEILKSKDLSRLITFVRKREADQPKKK